MKKIIIIYCSLIVIVFWVTGCQKEPCVADKVFRCYKENDFSTLEELFCQNSKDTHDLEKEFKDTMLMFDGKIVTENPEISILNSGEAIDDGIVTWRDQAYRISGIETNNEKLYKIIFHLYTENTNSEKIGITNIVIVDEQENESRIGERE